MNSKKFYDELNRLYLAMDQAEADGDFRACERIVRDILELENQYYAS